MCKCGEAQKLRKSWEEQKETERSHAELQDEEGEGGPSASIGRHQDLTLERKIDHIQDATVDLEEQQTDIAVNVFKLHKKVDRILEALKLKPKPIHGSKHDRDRDTDDHERKRTRHRKRNAGDMSSEDYGAEKPECRVLVPRARAA